jgi:hypothetical protein
LYLSARLPAAKHSTQLMSITGCTELNITCTFYVERGMSPVFSMQSREHHLYINRPVEK